MPGPVVTWQSPNSARTTEPARPMRVISYLYERIRFPPWNRRLSWCHLPDGSGRVIGPGKVIGLRGVTCLAATEQRRVSSRGPVSLIVIPCRRLGLPRDWGKCAGPCPVS